MVKVLMTGASNIGKAGVATVAFRLGQAMDENAVQLSYLAQRGISDDKYRQMIEKKGGNLYIMSGSGCSKTSGYLRTIRWIGAVCEKGDFDAVHINTDTAYLASIYIWLAKRAGIPKIIVHCHSTMVDENNKFLREIKIFLHKIFCPYVRKNSDLKLACSKSAARWLFGNDPATIIPNGFDVDRFAFSEVKREQYRRAFKMEKKFVLCAVGRLAYPKNLYFTIDIFKEILKWEKESILLLVGEGPLREGIEAYLKDNHLQHQVILLGNRDDVPELLSASDVFLLPSRFEGLGIVYVEAQASGMPVFGSDKVPEETFVTGLMHKIPLAASAAQWAKIILEHRNGKREDVRETIKNKGFDVEVAAGMLQKKYVELLG